jgi:hypothetical protein
MMSLQARFVLLGRQNRLNSTLRGKRKLAVSEGGGDVAEAEGAEAQEHRDDLDARRSVPGFI